MAYPKITIEISNICNAKCKWCTTGLKNRRGKIDKAHFMTASEFQRGIDELIDKDCLDYNTELELYNWGEPLLNPYINEIISIMENKKIHYHLSTNAYDISRFQPESLEYLTALKISICGITQSKYERIYGLDINKVKENIYKLYDILKEKGQNQNKLEISFLVYRFNVDEIIRAQKEFSGIKVVPRLAYFADYNQCQDWLLSKGGGNTDKQLQAEAEEDLWIEMLEEKKNAYQESFQCPQWGIMVIDDHWNIIPCCRLTSNDAIGNLFDLEYEEIVRLKNNLSKCKECVESKQHWLCNTSNEIYFGYKEALLAPYSDRNREIKNKFENALKSYERLKSKYEEALAAYQKLKEKNNK